MVVASGTMAHLKRLLTGEIDPSDVQKFFVLSLSEENRTIVPKHL